MVVKKYINYRWSWIYRYTCCQFITKSNYKVTVVDKIMFGSSSLLSFLGSDNFEFSILIKEDDDLITYLKTKIFRQ